MADVGFLFLRLRAKIFRVLASLADCARAGGNMMMRWATANRAAAILLFALTSCATTSTHNFAAPTANWQMHTGQLLYRNATATVIGDVVVRFSNAGDFELAFSKGPGIPLLVIEQDQTHARAKGPLARGLLGWSGPIERAPTHLRGWLGLRDAILRAKDRHLVRHSLGPETFVLRF
jgi:hypothetical protein